MIIEMRTYNLKPGTLAEVEKRFAEALPSREKHSKLGAFWRTEIGPLNQVIQVWPYESFEQRLAIRAAAVKDGTWPPKLVDFVVDQTSEIYVPAPFSPKLEPRQIGPIFEMRQYTIQVGGMQRVAVREASRKDGTWPPPGAPAGTLVKMENKILMPAPFSPIK